MKEIFKLALNDKITKWGLILSGIFLLLSIVSISFFYFSLPPLVPVFNQMPWGEKRLGIKITIFTPVLFAVVFLFLNFFISANLYEKTPLLSRMLSITAFLVSFLSFIFVARTVYLLI
jgi:hypothetical protein